VPQHVLIIDDDDAIRDMLALYLRGKGYRISKAADGESGLAQSRRERPDLILCDLRMPGQDGLTVLAEVSANFPELPVLIISGTAEMGDAIQALRLGAWDYITKPIMDFAVLDHAMERSLERARLLAENRSYRERLEAANGQLQQTLRQLEADAQAGQRIQFSLLPAPQVNFGPFSCSRFIKTSSFLSGDFIDYFTIDEHRFGFYIADVAGHGMSAAVVTVLLKSLVGRHLENHHHYGDETIVHPSLLLRRLNESILEGRHGKYVTMFYGVANSATGSVVCANAGQYPFPILQDAQATRWIGGKSPPVGLFPDADYVEEAQFLAPDARLAMVSDGVLDVLADQTLEVRKQHLLDAVAGRPPTAETLARALGIRDEAALPDDASILLITRAS